MQRSAFRGRELPENSIAWRETGYVALRANATDTCDGRVSEHSFDVENERAEA